MKNLAYLLIALCLLAACSSGEQSRGPAQILIFAEASSMNDQNEQRLLNDMAQIAQNKGIKANLSADPAFLEEDSLLAYGSLVLYKLDLAKLSVRQQADLQRYIQSGGGLISIDTKLEVPLTFPWMDSLLAKAQSPKEGIATKASDVSATSMKGFDVLSYDGGRAAIAKPNWQESFVDALNFAQGNNTYNLSTMRSPRAPKNNRFTKVVLDDQDVNEPMELTVLPDGRVLFIERRGKMKLYLPEEKRTKTIANFDVCLEGNYEDGLLGLAADPDFASNGYIYLYYSPPCDTLAQYLSQFYLKGDSLIMASENVLLRVEVQRQTCCHSGGSVRFDAQGNLWLSTGDNTSSKESNGYTPIDTRPGRGPYDAQKSSSNANDLRGKILRIRPNEDGYYDIPDGNLFPKDGSQGRPEIYIMGARNPFRIAVDDKTGYVYWGDVGPDAGQDGRYGSESRDEWNQARKPGFYGWPYFMGDNIAFPFRDFEEDTVGPLFDPAHPVNYSPNNTGIRDLPAAQPAFIWYGKNTSEKFPMLGKGSNSAMAGPIYYTPTSAAESTVKLPEYYEGKWFIYEWARSWIQLVTMNEKGDLIKIEPFLEEEEWVKPIEMEVGPDGALYVLEYGANYFMNNPKARLSRIEYAAGNRLPVPQLHASGTAGAAPYQVDFSANGSMDFDEEALSYQWFFTDTTQFQAEGENASFIFSEAGVYPVKLRAIDPQGGFADAHINIQVGNAPPQIEIGMSGNQSFYFDNDSREYQLTLADVEDQAAGALNPNNMDVKFVYVPDGQDLEVMLGENKAIDASFRFAKGLNLIKNSDCKSCHDPVIKSVGPSYQEMAAFYKNKSGVVDELANKIITGGNGVWGEKIMAGHPQHTLAETREMVRYILALGDEELGSLSPRGTLSLNQHLPKDEQGAYLFAASYTDQGANGIAPLSTRELIVLKAPILIGDYNDGSAKVGRRLEDIKAGRNNPVLPVYGNGAYLAFKGVDLSGVVAFDMRLQSFAGGTIELRLGSAEGERVGQVRLSAAKNAPYKQVRMPIEATEGKQDLYVVFVNDDPEARFLFNFDRIRLIPAAIN
ncbi:MAG: PQQ-dependent sugar dehydrogenase [Bacteroidota bacterium]